MNKESQFETGMEAAFLDRLMAMPTIYGGGLSPDGKYIAFLCRGKFAPVTQCYISSTKGQGKPRRILAETEGWDCDDFIWSRDARFLIVEQTRDGNELVRFMLVDVATGQWRQLTKEQDGIFIHGADFHPNNRYLVFSANQDPETGKPIETSVLFRRDIGSGETHALARLKNPAPFAGLGISPDGRHVLYCRADLDPAGSQIWLTDIEGKDDREIINLGAAVKAWGIWSKDSQSVLFIGEAKTHRRLGRYFLQDKRIEWLIDDPKRDLASIAWPDASPLPILSETLQAQLLVSLFDPDNKKETRIQLAGTTIAPLGKNDEEKWIVNRYDARNPDEYCLGSIDTQGRVHIGKPLTRLAEATFLDPEEMQPMEEFRWRSVDGLEIQAWLTRARGKAALGTIFYVHGGPTSHTENEFSVQVQYLARCGFHVVQPNYRGSTGFGLEFQESIKKEGWGGLEQEDIRSCAEALIAAGIAERGKIGITGVSYGGYSSWWAATHFPADLFAASMPICGMTDLVVDYEATRPDLRSYSEEMLGGSPSEVPDRYQERSPIHYVDRIKGKLLIVQGMTDPNVTPANLTAVAQKLDEAKIPYEVLAFDDEGHGIAKPKNRRTLYLRMSAFFAKAFADTKKDL